MMHRLTQAFRHAFNGLFLFFRSCRNARIHLLAALLAVATGFFLHISRWEWVAIMGCIAFVFCMEMVNEAVERLADVTQPEKDDRIRRLKDISAGMVLFAAIAAVVVAGLIFIPHLT